MISSPYDPKNDLEGAARIQKTREDILQGRDVMASASSPMHPVVVDDKEVSASGHGLGPIDIQPNSFPSGGTTAYGSGNEVRAGVLLASVTPEQVRGDGVGLGGGGLKRRSTR